SVSSALGPVLGGALVALAGWQAIFFANVPLVVVALLLALMWLPADPPRSNGHIAASSSSWQLLKSRRLLVVYAQFAAVNVVFYAVFYGWPLWLEQPRQYAPEVTGVLLLPVAGVGVLATPVAARLIDRAGPRPSIIFGSVLLLAGSLLLLTFNTDTPVAV